MSTVIVTGATGLTGRYLLPKLVGAGHNVTALTRRQAAAEALAQTPGVAPVVASLTDHDALARLFSPFDAVVHIGPALQRSEALLGTAVVNAIASLGDAAPYLVYFSVLHPHIESLLNHQAKLAVEREIINAHIPFTALRYTHLCQDIDVRRSVETGQMSQPFALSTPISFVDLADVVDVCALVLQHRQRHAYATYELCGPDYLTGTQVASAIAAAAQTPITPVYIPPRITVDNYRTHSLDHIYAAEATIRLFTYYSQHGLRGNPTVLTALLGRAPRSVADYIRAELHRDSAP